MITLLTFLFGMTLAQANDETEDIRIFVEGMVCSFCVQGVEKQFTKQDAIEKIEVDLEDSLVSVWLKENQDLSDETINKLIKDSGYNVESIERYSSEESETPKEEPPPKTPTPEPKTTETKKK